ncbi:MAG: Ig-like domain-containing protein [Myxococcales bacterium]|nr:Ig-like domain-containing protein [Myxococcales bacterium]
MALVGSLAGCGGDETKPPDEDTVAPFVTTSDPSEGATGVTPGTANLRLTFSEPMADDVGSLSLDGGTIQDRSWDGNTLVLQASLVPERACRLTLSGFTDIAGNALDGAPELGDGALDFTTGPGEITDTQSPQVTDADPNEGQMDVAIDTSAIVVTFDEPMDTNIVTIQLVGGSSTVGLSGSWNADGTVITFPLSAPLEHATAYSASLAAFGDVAGNPLDGAAYLGDGFLDFTTAGNPDTTAPIATASTPVEGSFTNDPDDPVITVTFNEDMDATITEVPVAVDGGTPAMVSGAWSDGDTLFTITLPGFLVPGGIYDIDLTGMQDEAGNPLDATDAYLGDGVLDFAAQNPSGEDCNAPLVLAQATENMGAHTWSVASGAVSGVDGEFACDASGSGSDVVVRYVKTSDTLANGGNLLHVAALNASDQINLEITSGNCNASLGAVESCLWFKNDWEKFLDVPPGTYWIWVADNDTSGGFPGVDITIEEIPASAPQAEGEGCFAPYTTSSANYTAPVNPDDFHIWTVPASINSPDIAASTAGAGSISCDDHPTYGDIHGVDAVIEFQKTSSTSVLLAEVDNLDPTLSQSDLDVEILTTCNPLDVGSTSLQCGANADTFAFTAQNMAGPLYLWVATEATGEEFNGAEVRLREINPGLGESLYTAEPLTSSGAISPTSAARFDAPSCFPSTGNIHWYSYTTTDTLFGVQGDVAGALAVFDGMGGELSCSTDTTNVAIGKNVAAGTTLFIAVESPGAIQSLTLIDLSYSGVMGTTSDFGVTFPTSATTEYSMVVGANEIFMGSTSSIWSFSKAGGGTAVEHDTADGLGSAQLGYGLAYAGGKLFSVDSTTSTTASRLFSVHDEGTMGWGPTAWDTPVSYPASAPTYAMTSDGTNIIMVSRPTSASSPSTFMSVPSSGPATATILGTNSDVYYATGIAADASYFYVVGRKALDATEWLFRIDRSNLSAPAVPLIPVDANTLATAVHVDDLVSAENIYVRDDSTDLHVVANPGSAPIDLGVLLSNGGTADYAMGIDRFSNQLFLFDSTLATNGGILMVQ